MKITKPKSAFTLAEVLITIGIIGVISALTIPSLITNYKRHCLETQFRKAQSQLQQVIKIWKEDETDDLYSEYYDDRDQKGVELRKAFYKYLKGDYFNGKSLGVDSVPYHTSAKGSTTLVHKCPASCCVEFIANSFITMDGIQYNVCARDGNLNFAVDINGYDKGPNKWGVDLFDFDYGEDNVLSNKYSCISSYCNTYFHTNSIGNTNDGMSCTACAVKDKNYFKKIEL